MSLTKDQMQAKLAELKDFIQAHKDDKGALMPIMQYAHDSFGFLSLEIQSVIAEGLGIPVSEVYGVATFYAQFSLQPKGEYVVGVCTGTACYVKGAAAVLELFVGPLQARAQHLFIGQRKKCFHVKQLDIQHCGRSPSFVVTVQI